MLRTFALIVLFTFSQLSFSVGEEITDQDSTTWGWRAALFSSILLSFALNPLGADESTVSAMLSEEEDVGAVKVGFKWFRDDLSLNILGAEVNHYYLVGYSYWQSLDVEGQEGVVNAIEFTPVFRLNWSYTSFLSYIETSVGLSLISRTALNDKQFSTNFQFTDNLAFGGYFTPHTSWSLQLQHFSNNSIKLPNNGINFYNLNFAFRY